MTYHSIIDSTKPCGDELLKLIDSLPDWRKEAALKHRFEQGQRECCLSYLLLYDMLREHFGITEPPRFVIGEHGKPTLDISGRDIRFNLSHCKRSVACIVSDTEEVGIDVECTGRYTAALADYCMSDAEREAIARAECADTEFTTLWTMKEALLKLTGEGITDDLRTILESARTEGVSFTSGISSDRQYAWSIARKEATASKEKEHFKLI